MSINSDFSEDQKIKNICRVLYYMYEEFRKQEYELNKKYTPKKSKIDLQKPFSLCVLTYRFDILQELMNITVYGLLGDEKADKILKEIIYEQFFDPKLIGIIDNEIVHHSFMADELFNDMKSVYNYYFKMKENKLKYTPSTNKKSQETLTKKHNEQLFKIYNTEAKLWVTIWNCLEYIKSHDICNDFIKIIQEDKLTYLLLYFQEFSDQETDYEYKNIAEIANKCHNQDIIHEKYQHQNKLLYDIQDGRDNDGQVKYLNPFNKVQTEINTYNFINKCLKLTGSDDQFRTGLYYPMIKCRMTLVTLVKKLPGASRHIESPITGAAVPLPRAGRPRNTK